MYNCRRDQSSRHSCRSIPDGLFLTEGAHRLSSPRAVPAVKPDRGKVAICRGPLVFCREGDFDAPVPDPTALDFVLSDGWGGAPEGSPVGCLSDRNRELAPYFTWGNRERMPLKVWLDQPG